MKTLRLTGIFMVFFVMLGCFSSCIEDEPEGNVPSQLLKTWYMDDGSSVTFYADGTGVFTDLDEESAAVKLMSRSATRDVHTLPFTYDYSEEDNSIFIYVENETLHLFIVTLTDDKLIVKDEEDNVLSLVKDLEAEVDITLLYHKKWLAEKGELYIFADNGEGSCEGKDGEGRLELTYEYDEETRELTIHTNGKVFRWSIISLTDDTLMVEDENGEILVLEAVKEVFWIEQLYGKWGICGRPMLSFTNQDNLCTFYEDDSDDTYTVKFRYDHLRKRIYFSELEDENWTEEDADMYWNVIACTNDYLKVLEYEREDKDSPFEPADFIFGFRIPEPNEFVVGDEMLLYKKEWKTFDEENGDEITLNFRNSFNDIVITGSDGKATVGFTYDSSTHQLTICNGNGEPDSVYEVTKLTEKVLYLEPVSGDVDYIELRR